MSHNNSPPRSRTLRIGSDNIPSSLANVNVTGAGSNIIGLGGKYSAVHRTATANIGSAS